jgi:hypothetical protein
MKKKRRRQAPGFVENAIFGNRHLNSEHGESRIQKAGLPDRVNASCMEE